MFWDWEIRLKNLIIPVFMVSDFFSQANLSLTQFSAVYSLFVFLMLFCPI